MNISHVYRVAALAAGSFLCTNAAQAGEKDLMHCFTFTAMKDATDADWQAFYKASEEMPKKIPGVKRVWTGKLARPMTFSQVTKVDDEAKKKIAEGEAAPAEVKRVVRQYAGCIEFKDAAALKAYAEHPYHAEWMKAYEKVRVEGTTTFDLLGQ